MYPSIARWSKRSHFVAVAAISFMSVTANAQRANLDNRSDIQRSRIDSILGPPSQPSMDSQLIRTKRALAAEEGQPATPAPAFTFSILAPLLFNSNALATQSNPTAAPEGNPELQLGWKHELNGMPIRLSALIDVNADRYANVAGADQDVTYAILKAKYFNAADDQAYEPFFEYSPSLTFDPTFAGHAVIQNDFSIGVDKAFNFAGHFSRLAAGPETSAAAVLSFGFTTKVQRRLQHSEGNSYALYLIPSISYVFSEQWNMSFEIDTIRRRYDSADGFSRRDWLISPVLTVEFQPPEQWFGGAARQAAIGNPVIDFQLSFSQVSSNKSGASYNQWVAGPLLNTSWRF